MLLFLWKGFSNFKVLMKLRQFEISNDLPNQSRNEECISIVQKKFKIFTLKKDV